MASTLTKRTHSHRHTKLESLAATFPSSSHSPHLKDSDGKTTLTITIEQTCSEFNEGEGFTDRDVPRMRINPSHGFAGYTRAESVWIQATIPILWDEWERLVGTGEVEE